MILAASFGLLSGLFAPKRWKFAVVSFWAVGFAITSTLKVFS